MISAIKKNMVHLLKSPKLFILNRNSECLFSFKKLKLGHRKQTIYFRCPQFRKSVLTAITIPILYNNFQTLCEAQQEQPSVSHTVCERAIEILCFLSLSFPPPILHTEAQEVGWRPRPILSPPPLLTSKSRSLRPL